MEVNQCNKLVLNWPKVQSFVIFRPISQRPYPTEPLPNLESSPMAPLVMPPNGHRIQALIGAIRPSITLQRLLFGTSKYHSSQQCKVHNFFHLKPLTFHFLIDLKVGMFAGTTPNIHLDKTLFKLGQSSWSPKINTDFWLLSICSYS